MAAADYRLLTEATGQRIAAALEALSGTGAAAAAARANLDVYSKGETDTAIAQSTADLVTPAWISVNPNYGLSYCQIGNIVAIRAIKYSVNITQDTTIGTLPSAVRPTYPFRVAGYNHTHAFAFDSEGTVVVQGSTNNLIANFVYVI